MFLAARPFETNVDDVADVDARPFVRALIVAVVATSDER